MDTEIVQVPEIEGATPISATAAIIPTIPTTSTVAAQVTPQESVQSSNTATKLYLQCVVNKNCTIQSLKRHPTDQNFTLSSGQYVCLSNFGINSEEEAMGNQELAFYLASGDFKLTREVPKYTKEHIENLKKADYMAEKREILSRIKDTNMRAMTLLKFYIEQYKNDPMIDGENIVSICERKLLSMNALEIN